jgi:serine/threonine protein kinase
MLGKGGFCTVSEVKKVKLLNGAANSTPTISFQNSRVVVQDRSYISSNYLRNNDARYAIKTLSPSLMNDPERFVAGVIDLVIETKFLSIIRHPNIVKMRAISSSSPFSIGYFIVLDRLYDTMTDRLQAWKNKRKKITGSAKVRDLKGEKKKELWVDRLIVSYDLCMALKYLHENR